jgi:ATP-dependent DNA ligase
MRRSPFDPCIPTKAAKVSDRPEWIYEIKHDGYRLIVQRDGSACGYGPATAMTGAIASR